MWVHVLSPSATMLCVVVPFPKQPLHGAQAKGVQQPADVEVLQRALILLKRCMLVFHTRHELGEFGSETSTTKTPMKQGHCRDTHLGDH